VPEKVYHRRRPPGDLLDLAFGLLRRQVWLFLSVSALVAVPATAVLSLLSTLVTNLSLDRGWAGLLWWPLDQPPEDALADDPLLFLLSMQAPNLTNLIEQVVVPNLALGALVHLAARTYHEEPASLKEAYRLGLPSALALLPVMGGLLLVRAVLAAAMTSSFILVTRLDSRILGLLLGLIVPALFSARLPGSTSG
jgi:hypothetical protein